MARLYFCLRDQHDWRLVVLAALICLIASGTTVYLMRLMRDAAGLTRTLALAEAGVAFGFGIWATHFVAMLAFHPGVALAYDVSLTALSLLIAVVLTLTSLALASWFGRPSLRASERRAPGRGWTLVGGALLGLGIAAMHATGIRALEIASVPQWSVPILAISLLTGSGFGALGLTLALQGRSLPTAIGAIAALVCAIAGHHFLALGALDLGTTFAADASIAPPLWLAAATAASSLAILLLALAAVRRDRQRRRRAQELARIRSLVDAAVEGLVICRAGIVVTANASFAELVGLPVADLEGRPFTDFLPPPCGLAWAEIAASQRLEADLVTAVEPIPVELIARHVETGGGSEVQVAIAVRDLRERRRAEETMRFLAHHDALTGLANRARFEAALNAALAHAKQHGTPLALLCLDLDRFKAVNDTLGHAAGDAVLKAVARRVTAQLPDEDLFARLGGDEFAILCRGRSADIAEDLASRIVAACAAPIEIGQTQVSIGTSIGIAVWPEAGPDARSLTGHADAALYCAKADGRSTWRRHDPGMRRAGAQRLLSAVTG